MSNQIIWILVHDHKEFYSLLIPFYLLFHGVTINCILFLHLFLHDKKTSLPQPTAETPFPYQNHLRNRHPLLVWHELYAIPRE